MTPGPGIFRTKLPRGFFASGVNCGVRRYRPDLGLIVSDREMVAVGVFTQNTCKAAPVLYSEALLPADNIRAIVTNSGQANAATGERGIEDNVSMAKSVARELGCLDSQVITASTGVIGDFMEIDKIVSSVPELVKNLTEISEKFATAILTTDLVPKTVSKELFLSEGKIVLTGICKGSGMIHPNMATMLAYILTDARLEAGQCQELLERANEDSFNMISVDGETSTNDCAFLLANGASGIEVKEGEIPLLQEAVREIAIILAKSIARDGEGATRLLTIKASRASDLLEAKRFARSLCESRLLQTAIYGESPNWGRVVSRLGMEGYKNLDRCSISFQGIEVFPFDSQKGYSKEDLLERMKSDEIVIEVDLNIGDASATSWGCDLSPRYVKINSEYAT